MLCKFKTEFTLEYYGITRISHPQRSHTKCELHSSGIRGVWGETCVPITGHLHCTPLQPATAEAFLSMPYPHTVLKFSSEYLILFSQNKNRVARHQIHSFSQMRKQARGSPGRLCPSPTIWTERSPPVLGQSWIIKWLNDRRKTEGQHTGLIPREEKNNKVL